MRFDSSVGEKYHDVRFGICPSREANVVASGSAMKDVSVRNIRHFASKAWY